MMDGRTHNRMIIPQNPTPQLVASCLRLIHHPRSPRHRWVSSQSQGASTSVLAVLIPLRLGSPTSMLASAIASRLSPR